MRLPALAAILLALFLAPLGPSMAERLEPLMVDWASYFRIDRQATSQGDHALVRGTVSNPTGWRYQVRVFAFDTSRRK